MNNVRTFYFVLFSMVLVSCQPPVVFGEPQPADTAPLALIPQDYRGIYWCEVDSITLYVDDLTFVKRKEFVLKLTEAEIDNSPDMMFTGQELYIEDLGAWFPAEKEGDTITSSVLFKDTIFSLGKEQIAKLFKGHLILNSKMTKDAWAVLVVSHKEDGVLVMARADLPDDLSQLQAVTAVDTTFEENEKRTQILIKPTREQFGQILQKRILFGGACNEFERIIPFESLSDH